MTREEFVAILTRLNDLYRPEHTATHEQAQREHTMMFNDIAALLEALGPHLGYEITVTATKAHHG